MLFRFLALVTTLRYIIHKTKFISQTNVCNREPAVETLHDIIFTYKTTENRCRGPTESSNQDVISVLSTYYQILATCHFSKWILMNLYIVHLPSWPIWLPNVRLFAVRKWLNSRNSTDKYNGYHVFIKLLRV